MTVNIKDINNKIGSILNTKKITKAMEMISITKMRKIELLMKNNRFYIFFMKKIINNFLLSNYNQKNIFLNNNIKMKKIIIIVISTEKGLCGSLNNNLFKKILNKINKYKKKNISSKLFIFGLKGYLFFKNNNCNIIKYINNIQETPNYKEIFPYLKKIFYMYKKFFFDHIFLANNYFENKIIQIPKIKQILPFKKKKKNIYKNIKNYLYEPNKKYLLNKIFKKYFITKIYHSFLENSSCEQASRMISMKNATDNSNNMIKNLQVLFNKIRQSNVTQELNEIVSGASAIL
ncbi:ATP synthase F1 subunit gamma [Buchnera aphidicola]|uniref:ATP synthase F1 subunit gamma n=1 Tax=Buchnera aphidicola TaxID=9 RepID=UPI0031B817FA